MSGPTTRVRGRLGRGPAVATVAVLGLALFVLTLPTWARATAPTTVGTADVAVAGSDAAPGVSSAALVVVVAGLVLALSGRVTRVLAVVSVVAGAGLATAAAIAFLVDPEPSVLLAAGQATGVGAVTGDIALTAFPVLAAVVGGLTTVLGLALPLLVGTWARVGRRYERDATAATPSPARPSTTRTRAMDDWDALSRGDDPSGPDPDPDPDTPSDPR